MSNTHGVLYVVATPIGNLADFTHRAQAVLEKVQVIAAEDTRHSRHLLTHFGINTPLQALHEHNERQATETLLNRLQAGESVALISDAGTPLISDPGRLLIETAHNARIQVVPIPGASALISALSVAGLSADKFVFAGFLPAKSNARQQQLQTLLSETRTLVFYEAPHRIVECITDMVQCFGEQRVGTLCKELTKLFETIYRDNLQGLLTWLTAEAERQKGEFVIVLQGAEPIDTQQLTAETERTMRILLTELPLKQAAKLASEITGVSKNTLYAWGLAQRA
ncbi:16S rRNA (cytidine(1402)-2'-O)-methyltransferase [Beggiatoa leptomitoformis]|uniref:Ribosomal RNA small subunit methyltransferase I n=1 Tax=Beggiatoa leptomitoformis TaxID=288004 RepID=A0A2N9YBE8_9GAMM|nr:16S rRNA (cytidine(1402)-2'-O)-methyltransferase [Beggiatoa leptomitoformis]ALG66899.1 16S rRNA (cytidine(1402)-2'-O)-methyltransferase [Beggiatoa leptomitoformis]AUI67739.1 16S rRNA (cytidine(1402)-2'-O)-methyltransferase [Beggiatoa leptomitoformis]